MSRNYKIYCLILLIGIGLAAWSVSKWKNTVDKRFDVLEDKPKKVNRRAPSERDLDYDRSGKVAAIRVFLATPPAGTWASPLFWAKGNLIVVSKKNWNGSDLDYQRCDVSREILHAMIDHVKALPKSMNSPEDLAITWTKADGSKSQHFESLDAFQIKMNEWFAERTIRAYVPQAIEMKLTKKKAGTLAVKWPVSAVSLAELAKGDPVVIRGKETIRRVQKVLRQPGFYRRGETTGWIEARARVDR